MEDMKVNLAICREVNMRYILENEKIKVEIESYGAELKSAICKDTKKEYMWQADPKFWGRTSPVLFPFVGDLVNKKYMFEGKAYDMTSHGFARDKEFDLVSKTENEIWFVLRDSQETYTNFPFHFELEVGYEIIGKQVKVKWKVYNPGQERENQNLYFSIGAHPAFICPIDGEADKCGYKLFFDAENEIKHHGNLRGTCTREDLTLVLNDGRVEITKDFFDRSTYIIENKQLKTIGIENPKGEKYVTVDFDTPLVAVWSPVGGKNAPFICIEPWWGRADYEDFRGDLTEREYGNVLEKGDTFKNTYTITFE